MVDQQLRMVWNMCGTGYPVAMYLRAQLYMANIMHIQWMLAIENTISAVEPDFGGFGTGIMVESGHHGW